MTQDPATDLAPGVEPASAVAPIGPRIWGVVDVLRADRIAGWAIDRRDAAAALDVDITRDGAVVRTVRADRHRADLEKGEVGTGNYGFRAEIDPPLEPGFEFTVAAVARAPDGATAALNRVGAAQRTPDPSTRLLERVYEETARLAAAASHARAPEPPSDAGRLADAIARIEVAQARLEAALAAVEPPKPAAGDLGRRLILFSTLGIAVASLGLGLLSLGWP